MAPKGGAGAAGAAAGGAAAVGAAAGGGHKKHKYGAEALDVNRALMLVIVAPMLAYIFEEMDVGEVMRWVWGCGIGVWAGMWAGRLGEKGDREGLVEGEGEEEDMGVRC